MKKSIFLLVSLALLGTLALNACSSSDGPTLLYFRSGT